MKAILKTSDHQKEKTEMKPVHATKLTAKRKLFVTSQGNTGKDLILLNTCETANYCSHVIPRSQVF